MFPSLSEYLYASLIQQILLSHDIQGVTGGMDQTSGGCSLC